MFGPASSNVHPNGPVNSSWSGCIASSKNQVAGVATSCSLGLFGPYCAAENSAAKDLAEAHRGLPNKGEQQEEHRDDRQNIDQRTESLISLRKLGQQIEGECSHPGKQQSVCGRYHV